MLRQEEMRRLFGKEGGWEMRGWKNRSDDEVYEGGKKRRRGCNVCSLYILLSTSNWVLCERWSIKISSLFLKKIATVPPTASSFSSSPWMPFSSLLRHHHHLLYSSSYSSFPFSPPFFPFLSRTFHIFKVARSLSPAVFSVSMASDRFYFQF